MRMGKICPRFNIDIVPMKYDTTPSTVQDLIPCQNKKRQGTRTGLPRNYRDKIPWLFHDSITKFHDLLIDIHISWILKSCCVVAPIHDNQEFVCKIPWFFHDFSLQFNNSFSMTLSICSQNSMTFPEIPENLKIPENPWLFHDRGNPDLYSFMRMHFFILELCARKNILPTIPPLELGFPSIINPHIFLWCPCGPKTDYNSWQN